MTFYEVLTGLHHTECKVAEQMIAYLNELDHGPAFEEMMRDAIDRAYVLGEVIDNLPVEIAEREI